MKNLEVAMFICLTVVFIFVISCITYNETQENYDYKIDLKFNKVNIETDNGFNYTIELDSLEEFIIKDNL